MFRQSKEKHELEPIVITTDIDDYLYSIKKLRKILELINSTYEDEELVVVDTIRLYGYETKFTDLNLQVVFYLRNKHNGAIRREYLKVECGSNSALFDTIRYSSMTPSVFISTIEKSISKYEDKANSIIGNFDIISCIDRIITFYDDMVNNRKEFEYQSSFGDIKITDNHLSFISVFKAHEEDYLFNNCFEYRIYVGEQLQYRDFHNELKSILEDCNKSKSLVDDLDEFKRLRYKYKKV